MVYFNGTSDLIGQFVNIRIEKTGGISLVGKIVD
jgi:hypothetical protein